MPLPQPILNVHLSPVNMTQALHTLQDWITTNARQYVCVAPAHSIMECVNDPNLLPVFNQAGMVTPDGMAVVWLLRLKGHRHVSRVYGPDLLLNACQYGLQHNWRHCFYGGAPGVAETLSQNLTRRFPGLQIAAALAPPFGELSPEQDRAFVRQINAAQPHIVWVGMSSPKQERWMHTHRHQIDAPVMVGVGAAFDFLSGTKPQAPRWMQRSGLEWLFRLASEPQRLWPRYRQYPRFAILALAEVLREKFGKHKPSAV